MKCPECGKRWMYKGLSGGTLDRCGSRTSFQYHCCRHCGGSVRREYPAHREVNPWALIVWPALIVIVIYVLS